MRTLTFVVVMSVVVAAQSPTVTVGTASAKPGDVAYGALQVPQGSDAATTIGVAVIRGDKPGKTVAFIAGSHGTEYASIVALTRLTAKIDPTRALRHDHRAAAAQRRVVRADDRARESRRQEGDERRLPGQRRRHPDGSRAGARGRPGRQAGRRRHRSAWRRSRRGPATVQLLDAHGQRGAGRGGQGARPGVRARPRRFCATSTRRIRRARGASAATRLRRARRRSLRRRGAAVSCSTRTSTRS